MIKRIVIVLFSLWIGAAYAAPEVSKFSCESFMSGIPQARPEGDPITATADYFSGKSAVQLEDLLGWIAGLLEQEDREKFIYEVHQHLRGAIIVRNKLGNTRDVKQAAKTVLFSDASVGVKPERTLNELFAAIRTVFSVDLGDVDQYKNASRIQKPNFIKQFKKRAVLVLFYQYKLYLSLLKLAQEPNLEVDRGPLKLIREFELPLPEKHRMRFFSPKEEQKLFDTVGLHFSLFQNLYQMNDQSDVALREAIRVEVVDDYVQMLEVYFAANPGILKNLRSSVAGLAVFGLVAAVLPPFGPLISIGKNSIAEFFESRPLAPAPIPELLSPAKLDEQLDILRKKQQPSENEKIILDELGNSKRD